MAAEEGGAAAEPNVWRGKKQAEVLDSTSPHALRLFTAMAVGESQLVLSHVTYLCYL